jgi:uncharacterized protein YnzC (UPF0291/DUF896 family)
VEKEKIDRINELARISKARELTADELAEQKSLREEYIAYVRKTLRASDGKVDKK